MAGSYEELNKLAGDYKGIAEKYGEGLQGKVAIVTGSNTGWCNVVRTVPFGWASLGAASPGTLQVMCFAGLGYEIARALSAVGMYVIIATRNPEKGEKCAKLASCNARFIGQTDRFKGRLC